MSRQKQGLDKKLKVMFDKSYGRGWVKEEHKFHFVILTLCISVIVHETLNNWYF